MDLRDALGQIGEIRRQMARTEVFRGYRSAPVAFTGLLALLGSVVQSRWIVEPTREPSAYLSLWIGIALVGLAAAGLEMFHRASRSSRWAREQTWLAVEQFSPCLVAGGLTTIVLARSGESELWMLPGLWATFFALGIFASRRSLPKATQGVACFYLLAGVVNLAIARDEWALSPWAMGLTFGIGQLYGAAVLYRTLERDHGAL